jgi:hypothetical protein
MQPGTIGNIATAVFFFVLAGLFLVSFLLGFDWPLEGRAASIAFAILFAGLGCRVLWGMKHGE